MNVAARPLVPLGDFMLEKGSSVDPAKRSDDRFVLYSIPSFDVGKPETVSGHEIGSPKKKVESGDVLLSRIVPHIRRSWIVGDHPNFEILASGEWIVFRSQKIYASYLRHFLISDVFHPQFMKTVAGVGGSLLRAKPNYVAEIAIPLPPLDEQRRIAAMLDKADALRRKRKRALELLDGLAQSIFLEMFGDPQTNPKNWKSVRIGDLLDETQYGTSAKAGNVGRYRILRMGNITSDGKIDLKDLKYIDIADNDTDKFLVRKGDILFNRTNSAELVGKTAVFDQDEPFAFAGYLVRARVKKDVSPEYVSTYLNSRHGKAVLRSMAKSIVGMANINARELQSIPILQPSIEAQRQFTAALKTVLKRRDQHSAFADAADRLFSSLQYRAFSGQL